MGKSLRLLAPLALLAIIRRRRARANAIIAQQVHTAPRRADLQITRSAKFVPLGNMGHSLGNPLRLSASPALLAIMRRHLVQAVAIMAQQDHIASRQSELQIARWITIA